MFCGGRHPFWSDGGLQQRAYSERKVMFETKVGLHYAGGRVGSTLGGTKWVYQLSSTTGTPISSTSNSMMHSRVSECVDNSSAEHDVTKRWRRTCPSQLAAMPSADGIDHHIPARSFCNREHNLIRPGRCFGAAGWSRGMGYDSPCLKGTATYEVCIFTMLIVGGVNNSA